MMAERLNITVDDGVGDLLANLAGSRNKMGEMVSQLAKAASLSAEVPAVQDVETLRLMILGMTAEIKALRISHEQLREFIGDPYDLTYRKWKTVTGALGHMVAKEDLIHNMHARLTAIDGNWHEDWDVDEDEWQPHARRAGSEEALLLAERVRRLEEATDLRN